METSVDNWRIKIFSRKTKEKLEDCGDEPSCSNCRYVKSKTCGSKKEKLKCKKPPPIPNPSLSSLGKSMSANCCTCCCMLLEFLKEAYKTIGGDPKTRVCELLGEMSDLMLALANDCVLFIRRICCCMVSNIN